MIMVCVLNHKLREISLSSLFEKKYELFDRKKENEISLFSSDNLDYERARFILQLYSFDENSAIFFADKWDINIEDIKQQLELENKLQTKEIGGENKEIKNIF